VPDRATEAAPRGGSRESGPLLLRLARYQAERFPLAGFVPLIALFTFASATFSRLARHAPGGVDPLVLAVGTFTSLTCFFLLRVLDEHKDAEDDRRFRPDLPVPRGLVSLRELRVVGGILAAAALAMNAAVLPKLLLPLAAVATWATLMTLEFGVRRWLRAHASAYLLTHMAIMPLIDLYTTGLDWLAGGLHPPDGLPWFLGVTFANGVLIEIGRKIRMPADERPGVDTYTHAWGTRVAPCVWLLVLAASAALAIAAAGHVGWPASGAAWFAGIALAAAAPAILFLLHPRRAAARGLDGASQLWPAITYVLLGVLPLWLPALMGRM
jgi:4-hydroxybenzoate polyprenyltransferase